MAASSDPVRFRTALQSRDSVSDCAALFGSVVGKRGFSVFACGEIDLDNRSRIVLFVTHWPDDWLAYYLRSGFVERDPVIEALRVYRRAFTWTDIIRDKQFAKSDREALRMTAQYGWREGLVVPIARGGTRYGLVSLVGSPARISTAQREQLCVICETFLTRVRALGDARRFPVPPAGLSEREIEALALVTRGFSDADIGSALGISSSTAHKHVEAARKQLQAKTRAHMAALGVSMGIVAGG